MHLPLPLRTEIKNQKINKTIEIFSVKCYYTQVTDSVIDKCGYGGIGRHARFRILWETVQVQVLLPAPMTEDAVNASSVLL